MVLENELELTKERDSVVKWLNIKRPIKRGNTKFTYINIIQNRLDGKSVNSFIEHSRLSKKQVARLIHISERTLQRNTPEKKIDINASEKLLELARLFFTGLELFKSKTKFVLWLNRPNQSLQNIKPMELIETNIGVELVLDELVRIEYGVFS